MMEFLASKYEEHSMLAIPLKGSGERSVTDIKWKVNKDTPETPSPLVVGESVLFIKNGGIVTVLDRESGEVVYHRSQSMMYYTSERINIYMHFVSCKL